MSNPLYQTTFKRSCFFFTFVILKYHLLAYNLDVDNAKVFNIPATFNKQRGSYFGFSVALYTNEEDSVLLVGAPRANTSSLRGVIEPGTVYQCPINETCKEWAIDKAGNGWHKRYSTINQIKDGAWIGATIAIENRTNPRIVICGPRWKNNIMNKNRPNWFMNGICYSSLIKNVTSFEREAENEILPLSNVAQQTVSMGGIHIYNYGMGQVGFSIHMTSNEFIWDLILGSPGVFNWKGTPLLITQSMYGKTRTVIPSIRNERRIHTNDYFGYSVTSGYFIRGELWFASGAPRSANMFGSVILFTFSDESNTKLLVKQSVVGKSYGEYFGAALTSCNVDGDDKDELIVGAPQWSKDMDEGRIYVFSSMYDEIFGRQSIDGEVPGGRFGTAITCLGDIDHDGYSDIAVGAPYEEQTGTIYIFNGNSNGLPKRYTQRIPGKQFGANIRGFGIAISDPRDINGDKYPDIAVGSYLSEQAVLIKSKPVITVIAKLLYQETKKLLRNTTFFYIDVCASYDGINAPNHIRIVKSLKIDQMFKRAHYSMEKSNVSAYQYIDTLHKAKNLCNQLKIHLKENIQNIIDPVEISISVSLEEDIRPKNENIKPNLFCTSCASINQIHSKTENLIKLPFAVDCGEDNICISDVKILLSTDLKSNNEYIIGSMSTAKFTIDIFNHGEPAYQATMCIYIPEILSLASVPPACTESIHINNTLEVMCDLGNPLRNDKRLILYLDMSKVRYDNDHVVLTTNFSTQSEERNTDDNSPSLTVYFNADVDIAIAGKAQDDLYSYFLERESEKLNSVQFEHVYEVQKFGASPIDEVILTISVPTYWTSSDGDIRIANINQTIGYMDGEPFQCAYTNSTLLSSIHNKLETSTNAKYHMEEGFTMDSNFSINLPPENRSIYINCTSPYVMCSYIKCELGPFLSSSSVAKLSLRLDFFLFDFKSTKMETKDIIFFLSSGNVTILQPHNIIQKDGHKPDSTIVATMFLGSPVAEQIATWIVILSIVLGILLLTLLILILIKVGFFNRKKKEELEALKSQTNKEHNIILETCSSRECLDQEEVY